MADVLVKDVAEIRLFSVGVQDFHERYESQLILVERAIDDDMATAKSLLGALENKVSQAASHLHSCQQALQSYLASQAGRKDSEGNPVPPDPDVVRRLTNAIHEAEARLARAVVVTKRARRNAIRHVWHCRWRHPPRCQAEGLSAMRCTAHALPSNVRPCILKHTKVKLMIIALCQKH